MATRLTFLIIGAYSFLFDKQQIPWLRMWLHWDTSYYFSIADHGYRPPDVVTGDETGFSNVNFFPMLPIIIRGCRFLSPSLNVAGLAAANLCLLAAAIMLHRLAARRFDQHAADWAVLSLMLLPGSFAISGPLTEAPFLALSVSAAYLVDINIGSAAILSSLLGITRLTGFLQGLGFALDWVVARARGRGVSYGRLLPICLIPLPLLMFLCYMYVVTGDALAPLHSNTAFWHHRFGVPFSALFLFVSDKQPRLQMQSALALAFTIIMLSQMRRLTPGEALFAIASVASFSSSLSASLSLVRYMIGLYPLHLAMGRLCAGSAAMRVLLMCLALIGAALSVLWFHGSDVYI